MKILWVRILTYICFINSNICPLQISVVQFFHLNVVLICLFLTYYQKKSTLQGMGQSQMKQRTLRGSGRPPISWSVQIFIRFFFRTLKSFRYSARYWSKSLKFGHSAYIDDKLEMTFGQFKFEKRMHRTKNRKNGSSLN